MKKTPFLLYGFPHLHHTTNVQELKPYVEEKSMPYRFCPHQHHINIAIQHIFPLFTHFKI
ncbi:hypothetical protein BAX60_04530 [Bacillus subtilis]|nr:hypothetical protein BAX60_04530 [Bacillus subtilis]